MKKNRRDFIKKSSGLAALSVAGSGLIQPDIYGAVIATNPDILRKKSAKRAEWPILEVPGTPSCTGC
jgi:hypothetical protein